LLITGIPNESTTISIFVAKDEPADSMALLIEGFFGVIISLGVRALVATKLPGYI